MLVGGGDLAPGDGLDDPDERVDDDVAADTGDETVGDGVREAHDGDGEESRHGVAHVAPVDLGDGANHHGSDQDENAARGPGRDRREDGREEDGDEEADTRRHGRNARLATFADTCTRLDEGGDGGGSEDGADSDTDGINEVGHGRALKVLRVLVDEVGKAGHGVECARAIEDIDVEEGDEGAGELAAVVANVPSLNGQDAANWVEIDHALEEVEGVIADGRVREGGDGGASGPRRNRHDQNANQDSTLDAEHGEHDGEDTAAEDTQPQGRVTHLMRARADTVHYLIRGATCQGHGSRHGTGDEADTLAVGQTNQGQEETDTSTCGKLDGLGDGTGEPLTQTKDGQTEEDETLDEDGGHGHVVGDGAGAVETNDVVCQIRVQTHTAANTNWPVSSC